MTAAITISDNVVTDVAESPVPAGPLFSTVTSKRWIPLDVMWVSSTFALSDAVTADLEAERPMVNLFVIYWDVDAMLH